MCGRPAAYTPLLPHAPVYTRVHPHHPCARQPDGSVHGNAHSYGPYDGMSVSLSIMMTNEHSDDGRKSWRLCDTPQACTYRTCSTTLSTSRQRVLFTQASIWGKPRDDDLSACYPDSECTSPDWYNGTDCWAVWGEACSCSRGYAKTTGKVFYSDLHLIHKYKCCPDGEIEEISGESEEMCVGKNVAWTPGVCYHVRNWTLTGATYSALSEPLHDCEVHGARVHGLLIGMILLATVRILLQVVWYRRCNAKLDSGKKGLNLWLATIPIVATGVVGQYYWQDCMVHMGIYSLVSDPENFIYDPEMFRDLADSQPPPKVGTLICWLYMLTLSMCASLWVSNLDCEISLASIYTLCYSHVRAAAQTSWS